MDYELAEQERASYCQRGFFVRRAVFTPAELQALREAVEAVHARVVAAAGQCGAPVQEIDGRRYQTLLGSTVKWEWSEDAAEVRSMEPFAHLDTSLPDLIDDPRLTAPISGLLGGQRLSLFTDKLNFKRPGGAPFPWHQDTPYWAFGCEHVDRLASVQLYLDDADADNGCLWMIAGSQRGGVLPGVQDRGTLDRLYTREADLDPAAMLAIEAPAGTLIFFDGDVVHGSRGNRSARDRRAIVLTYQPAGLPRWNRPDDVRDVRLPDAG